MFKNNARLSIAFSVGLMMSFMLTTDSIGDPPAEKEIAIFATTDGNLYKIDLASQEVVMKIEIPKEEFFPAGIDSSADRLYVHSAMGRKDLVLVFNTKELKLCKEIKLPGDYATESIKLSPDGKHLVVMQINPENPLSTLVFDTNNGKLITRLGIFLLAGESVFSTTEDDKFFTLWRGVIYHCTLQGNVKKIQVPKEFFDFPDYLEFYGDKFLATAMYRSNGEVVPCLVEVDLNNGKVKKILSNVYGEVRVNPTKNVIYLLDTKFVPVKLGERVETRRERTNIIKIIDAEKMTTIGAINLPKNLGEPNGQMFLSPSGKYLLATYGMSYREPGYIVLIDTNTHEVIKTFTVSDSPTNIVFLY